MKKEIKLDIALNIIGLFTAINEQEREKNGTDKYDVHSFIRAVKADRLTIAELIILNEQAKEELIDVLDSKHEDKKFKSAIDKMFEAVFSEKEDNDDLEEECESCDACDMKDVCGSESDEDEEELALEELENLLEKLVALIDKTESKR